MNLTDVKADKTLSLVFYDVNRPDDPTFWAGTSAHIINQLRNQGQRVAVVGNNVPRLRRFLLALLYHYYRIVHKLHYHPDRHVLLTRLYSIVGSVKLRRHDAADAILTVSAAFSAFLQTSRPIFILLDATWGQIVETYPYFHASKQPKHIVEGGLLLDKLAFNRPNVHLVMTSAWAAHRAIVDYKIDASRVHILPFGANFDHEPLSSSVQDGLHARTGNHCNLLFVGREFERKGGVLAIQIARQLIVLGIPVTLHIVGCKPPALPSFAISYGLLRKSLPEEEQLLHHLYRTSDFFLMPSRGEAQGIVFNEAAAYALPVVATDVGGVSAVVKHGDWGFLGNVDEGPERYVHWIRSLFLDRPRYFKVAGLARQDYEQRLSGSAYAKALVSLITLAVHPF